MGRFIKGLSWRQRFFMLFVLMVLGESVSEIVGEIAEGQALIEMVDDIAMFVVSLVVVCLFAIEYWRQQQSLSELQARFASSAGKLAQVDADTPRIANQYREVMQKQFDVWKLTASEQDVVLGLLKGLSFREVAEIRDTREKTVRQQAANVYRKAGVAGRHELAGWFFEDLLQSPQRVSPGVPAVVASGEADAREESLR